MTLVNRLVHPPSSHPVRVKSCVCDVIMLRRHGMQEFGAQCTVHHGVCV